MPSVFKDPFSKGVSVRDAPSLGHYAHRLRLAADGEWLLQLSMPPTEYLSKQSGPNVPLRPHKGKVYEWNYRAWQEKDLTLFVQHCLSAERLPGLQMLTELSDWIQMNLGGESTYSPSYNEFIEQRVQLPKNDRSRVLSLLKSSKDVWLRGYPACGKTVFGISIALDWMADKNGRCLLFDIKDLEFDRPQFLEKAQTDIDWFVNIVPYPLLLILDNVHTDHSLALNLLRNVQEKRELGIQIQILLIGRYSKEPPTERNSLIDNELLEPIDLKANEEAFMCVAKRISLKRGIAQNYTSSQGIKWVRECGGDLVVFSTAFDPIHPENIDQSFISKMVRLRYMSPIEQQGEREAFLDLCAMSSLDLNTEDLAIWGRSAETVFSQFISNGAIQRVPMKPGNPREYCRLFHSSLGDLILRVETNFSSVAKQKLWLKLALDLCRRHPFLLSLMYFKLYSGSYDDIANMNQWRDAINGEHDLVEQAVCHSPLFSILMLRRGGLDFSWSRLQNISNMSGYNLLIANLSRTPAGGIVTFLKYLDDKELSDERKNLLEVLLKHEEFAQHLFFSPTGATGNFINYLFKSGNQSQAQQLLDNSWNSLNLASFEQYIANSPLTELTGIQRAIRNSRLKLNEELWEALIKKIVGPSFKPVIPDPEHPQDELLSKSTGDLIELLTGLDQARNRYKMNCIVKSLIYDMDKFEAWIRSQHSQELSLIREKIVQLRINLPSEAWALMGSPVENGIYDDESK